jgi:hypothetical protein
LAPEGAVARIEADAPGLGAGGAQHAGKAMKERTMRTLQKQKHAPRLRRFHVPFFCPVNHLRDTALSFGRNYDQNGVLGQAGACPPPGAPLGQQ